MTCSCCQRRARIQPPLAVVRSKVNLTNGANYATDNIDRRASFRELPAACLAMARPTFVPSATQSLRGGAPAGTVPMIRADCLQNERTRCACGCLAAPGPTAAIAGGCASGAWLDSPLPGELATSPPKNTYPTALGAAS